MDRFPQLAQLREGDMVTASHITQLARLLALVDRYAALAGIDGHPSSGQLRPYDQDEDEEVY